MWGSGSSGSELEFNEAAGSKKQGKKNKNKHQTKGKKVKTTTANKKEEPKKDNGVLNSSPVRVSSSSEEESDDDGGAMGYGKQALGIDPFEVENYDGKSSPQNGSQYLLSVIKETKNSPKTVVADGSVIASKLATAQSVNYLDNFKREVDFCNVSQLNLKNPLIPPEGWREEKLNDFSLLRSKVERWTELLAKGVTKIKTSPVKLPEVGNRVVWQRFCFGIKFEELVATRKQSENITVDTIVTDYFKDLKGSSKVGSLIKVDSQDLDSCPLSPASITCTNHVESTKASSSSTSSEANKALIPEIGNDGCQPLMSILLVLPQKQVEQLLYYQSNLVSRYGFLNKCQGEWLYALLSCVSKPLEPSTMADIRNICKSLISIRNDFYSKFKKHCESEKSNLCDDNKVEKLSDDMMKDLSLDSETEENEKVSEYINALNLFIYVIGDYFCQKDLVMELS